MDLNFLIPVTLFIVTGYIIKVISDNRLRQRLIEKGMVDEKSKYLFLNNRQVYNLSSLKWGLVLVGLGLALFAGQLFPYRNIEEITVGAMFLFAGLGFLVYYFIAKKISMNNFEQEASENPSKK